MQQWHPDNTDAVSRAMSDTVTSEMFVVLGLRVSLTLLARPLLQIVVSAHHRLDILLAIPLLRIAVSRADRSYCMPA